MPNAWSIAWSWVAHISSVSIKAALPFTSTLYSNRRGHESFACSALIHSSSGGNWILTVSTWWIPVGKQKSANSFHTSFLCFSFVGAKWSNFCHKRLRLAFELWFSSFSVRTSSLLCSWRTEVNMLPSRTWASYYEVVQVTNTSVKKVLSHSQSYIFSNITCGQSVMTTVQFW